MPKERPSILLVDDHPLNLITLEAVLGNSEYHLLKASSGEAALALLRSHDVALILLDIQMPGMDGYEVARRVKSQEETRHIPIILITAIYREDPHVRKGYEVGAVEFFAKPFNPAVLRFKVGIYAELYRKTRALRRREEEITAMKKSLFALHETLVEREHGRQREENRRGAEIKAILDLIPDAIYIGDETGVTRCNSAAVVLFGLGGPGECRQPSEQLADRLHMRYPDSGKRIPPHDQPIPRALRGERFDCGIKIRNASTGKDLDIACQGTPVLYDGEIVGAVVVNTGAGA